MEAMEAMETTDTASQARERQERGHARDYTGGGGGGTFARNELLAWAVERWPITAEVRDAITAEYDGDLGTARDIGQRLGGIPSWHITAIAHALGLLEPRQRARIRDGGSPAIPLGIVPTPPTPTPTPTTPTPVESSAPIAPITHVEPTPVEPIESEGTTVSQYATLPERSADQPDETPDETPEPVEAPAPSRRVKVYRYKTREASCERCGAPFMSKRYSDGWTRYCGSGCGGAAGRQQQIATTTAAPVEAPATVAQPATRAGEKWGKTTAATPEPAQTRPALLPGALSMNDAPYQRTPEPISPLSPRRLLRLSLHTLVDALPTGDSWPDSDRSRWLEALTGILDFTIERLPNALDWRADQ